MSAQRGWATSYCAHRVNKTNETSIPARLARDPPRPSIEISLHPLLKYGNCRKTVTRQKRVPRPNFLGIWAMFNPILPDGALLHCAWARPHATVLLTLSKLALHYKVLDQPPFRNRQHDSELGPFQCVPVGDYSPGGVSLVADTPHRTNKVQKIGNGVEGESKQSAGLVGSPLTRSRPSNYQNAKRLRWLGPFAPRSIWCSS
ncbi:hypothetical protein BDM02DRAFT_2716980 [Thelephora ganbajun]|uniref:Uncharacterized protein n=1 Tax=Thelephora ganbajun TaxID=370292 RepID=A0ACB6ZCI0_THEGA|nr:hypothetical protein BDM02DRAFT_2716980 [Thelephora ganbajun]